MNYEKRYYRARLHLLNHLGYDSYAEYLQSPLWLSIRKSVIERDKFKCRLCGYPSTQVHHRNYSEKVLIGATLDDSMIAVCTKCHQKIEFDENGNKRGPFAVENLVARELKYIQSGCDTKPKPVPVTQRQPKGLCVICGLFQVKGRSRICGTCVPFANHPGTVKRRLWIRASGLKQDRKWIENRISTAVRRLVEIENAVMRAVPEWEMEPTEGLISKPLPNPTL